MTILILNVIHLLLVVLIGVASLIPDADEIRWQARQREEKLERRRSHRLFSRRGSETKVLELRQLVLYWAHRIPSGFSVTKWLKRR